MSNLYDKFVKILNEYSKCNSKDYEEIIKYYRFFIINKSEKKFKELYPSIYKDVFVPLWKQYFEDIESLKCENFLESEKLYTLYFSCIDLKISKKDIMHILGLFVDEIDQISLKSGMCIKDDSTNLSIENKNNVFLYTDGSCKNNPGAGACAYVVVENENVIHKNVLFFPSTTNNQMELQGVIQGLRFLQEFKNIVVRTDSQYVTNAFNQNWIVSWQKNGWESKTGMVKNKELWIELLNLIKNKNVVFEHIKGHNGNIYNEMCDKLAKQCVKDNI